MEIAERIAARNNEAFTIPYHTLENTGININIGIPESKSKNVNNRECIQANSDVTAWLQVWTPLCESIECVRLDKSATAKLYQNESQRNPMRKKGNCPVRTKIAFVLTVFVFIFSGRSPSSNHTELTFYCIFGRLYNALIICKKWS